MDYIDVTYENTILVLRKIQNEDTTSLARRSELGKAIRAVEKQITKPPVPDNNATGIDGKPVLRCQVCGYALDLRMEQYCPCCGQRLTEYEEEKDEA